MKTQQHTYTVSELTRDIKIILEDSFSAVWIEGEISNFKQHFSGHMYFTLKDKNSQLNCVFFKYANKKVKFEIKDGMQAVLFGKVGVYEKTGQYQLYVEKIEPKGLGALQLAFTQLKERLGKEGLFDKERKRAIPEFPTRIGVVTSPTGAAIQDILNVLSRRFADLTVILNPVQVQGDTASAQIAQAIGEFNNIKELSSGKISDIDVVIVTRGGGSLEDLWAFNEELVAREIFNSKIPVISAVGHETDWTISDFVSDLRVPTPSAAAEMVIEQKGQLAEQIENSIARLESSMAAKLELADSQLTGLTESYYFKNPMNLISLSQERFGNLVGKLETLSPLAILSRGYSITKALDEDRVIKDSTCLRKGDMLLTKLHKGHVTSEVVEVQNARSKI